MGFKLDRIHVWSGEVADQAGAVQALLWLGFRLLRSGDLVGAAAVY